MLYALLMSLSLAASDSIALSEGDKAPFDGILITRETAIEILSDDHENDLLIQAELELAKQKCDLELDFNKKLYTAQEEGYKKEIEYLELAIEKRNKMILKENNNFRESINFIGGVVIGVGITIGVLFAADNALGK